MATDDLTATVHSALTALDPGRKAQFLLDTALTLIDAGRYVHLTLHTIPLLTELGVGMATTLKST